MNAGFPRPTISLVEGSRQPNPLTTTNEGGFSGKSLKDFFFPTNTSDTYAEGLRRGGFLITATTTEANWQRAVDILEREGAVDIDERAKMWRKEGWTGMSPQSRKVCRHPVAIEWCQSWKSSRKSASERWKAAECACIATSLRISR